VPRERKKFYADYITLPLLFSLLPSIGRGYSRKGGIKEILGGRGKKREGRAPIYINSSIFPLFYQEDY